MKKKIVLLAVLVATTAAVCWAKGWLGFNSGSEPAGKIFVNGNIEAVEVDLAFRIGGQIKTLPIEEGDRVVKDQEISTLDTDTLLAQQGAARAEIATARAVLDELEAGTRQEEIDGARAAFKAAESRLENARAEYDRYVVLFKEKAISGSLFDKRETELKVAREEFNNARERLTQLERGPREQQIRAAGHRLERAQWELKKIDLDVAHSRLETPITGVVLVKSNEEGEVVLPGATVATVAKVDEVWLKGYVSELHLGKVKLGQRVETNTDTYPGKIYEGRVTFISPKAEFTPKNVQTKEERVKQVYRIKVTIPNPHQELKIGMPAEGYILVGDPK